jgi:hypothetical protein
MERRVVYFDVPGAENTERVIECVKERLGEGDLRYIVVASESGETALKVAEALRGFDVKLICVSGYAGIRRARGRRWPDIQGETRRRLEELEVKIIEETPWIFGCSIDHQLLGPYTPSYAIHRFLSRTMGFGFKTALEVALIAAEAGALPLDEECISVAGTGYLGGGADTALVVKPSILFDGKFLDLREGLEVREILAIPRIKFSDELIERLRRES